MGVVAINAANKIWGGYAANVAGRAFVARGAAVLGKFGAQLAPIEAGGGAELIDQAAAERIHTLAEIRRYSTGLQGTVAPDASHRQAKAEQDQALSAPSRLMADLNDRRPSSAPGRSIRGRGPSPRGRSPDAMGVASGRPENRGLSALLHCPSIERATHRDQRVGVPIVQTSATAYGVGGFNRAKASVGDGQNGVGGMSRLQVEQGAAFGAVERIRGRYARLSRTVNQTSPMTVDNAAGGGAMTGRVISPEARAAMSAGGKRASDQARAEKAEGMAFARAWREANRGVDWSLPQ